MSDIGVHKSESDGRVTLSLQGELDIGSAERVERVVREQESEGCRELILDLQELRFIDSSGLRLIISAQARAEEGGWDLAIVPGPERVHRVFRIAGLADRLPFTEKRPYGEDPD